VGKVAVNGTRERGDESIAGLEHTEVDLNAHAKIEERDMHGGRHFLHVLARCGDEQTFTLNEEVALKLFGHIRCIGNEESIQFRIHLFEDGAIISVARGEPECKDSALKISGKVKF